MSKIRVRLAAGAVLAALSATSFLAAEPAASAAPSVATRAPGASATLEGREVIKVGWEDDASKHLRHKAARVVTMVQKAKTKHGHYDYRKMNTYDNTHVKWRREAAAYLIWLGKDVTHLSRAERKKVQAFKPGRSYAKVKFDEAGVALAARRGGGKVCTGWTGYLITDSVQLPFPGIVKYWLFLNSCHTNALQYAMELEAGAFALFGAFFPPSIPVVETVAFLEGVVGAGSIELAQSSSGLDAILLTKDVARLALVSQ